MEGHPWSEFVITIKKYWPNFRLANFQGALEKFIVQYKFNTRNYFLLKLRDYHIINVSIIG